jgi:hypothetical protein
MKMIISLIIGCAAIFATQYAKAQAPAIQWQKSLGGTLEDWASDIQQTSDGGYIIAGYTLSNDGDVTGNHGGSDMWVVKLNSSGTIEWQKALGGTGQDFANAIRQTSDGGYIVAGVSSSFDEDIAGDNNGGDDAWIVKLTSTGDITWAKSHGTTNDEAATAICESSNGGYWVVGVKDVSGNNDYWILRLDDNGNIDAQATLGGSLGDRPTAVEETSDGIIVSGYSESSDGDVSGNNGSTDFWILKIAGGFILEWVECYGGSSSEYAYDVTQTSDGGYILTGQTYSNDGDVSGYNLEGDFWVLKLSGTGAVEWQKCLGGTDYDRGNSVQPTTDGGYIVTGVTFSDDGDVSGNHGADYWVVKLNNTGDISWQKCLGGPTSESAAFAITQTTDGGYVVAGVSEGNGGDITGNHGDYDFWIVKLAADIVGVEENKSVANFMLYPNPVADMLSIVDAPVGSSINITDIAGKLIFSSAITQEKTNINTTHFVNGIYLVQVENKGQLQSKKFVVSK